MADKKISQLNTATTPLVGTEVLPIVQGGQTVKTTVQAIANLSYQDITYSQLYNKVVNGQLVPGQWYRLTDYKSVNFLNGWTLANQNPASGPNFNPREIYEGDTEVLILQATSPYEISEVGYSETFNGDVVTYLPYVNKIGVDIGGIFNGGTLPDSTTVSGFDLQWDGTNVYFNMPTGYPALLGHYFYIYCDFVGSYVQDGVFEPLTAGISVCQYPYSYGDLSSSEPKAVSRIRVENNGQKIVLIDLTQADYNNYNSSSLYVETVYAVGDAYGWIVRRQDTQRNIDVPFDFRGRKYRRFEVDLSGVNAALGTYYVGIGNDFLGQGTTGNYKDYDCFPNATTGAIGEAYNIKWSDRGGPDVFYYNGFNDNNIFGRYTFQNIIDGKFYNNTFNGAVYPDFYNNNINVSYFHNNTFINGALHNQISCDGFANNIVYSFSQNDLNVNQFNFNKFTDSFFLNNIQCLSFNSNTFGGTSINNIAGFFYNQFFGISFSNNIINNIGGAPVTFRNNTFGNTTIVSGIDFSASVHVLNDYTCNIFKRSDGTDQLSYVSGTNVVTYAAVNA